MEQPTAKHPRLPRASTEAEGESKRRPYGEAQETFVRETRQAIDANSCLAFEQDWSNIVPWPSSRTLGGGNDSRRPTSSYNVKPIACFVPHLIIKNHVPYCPICQSNASVDIGRARWVKFPKVVFGLKCHRYLDTKLYPCRDCNRWFNGTNEESMTLGNTRVLGRFSFYMGAPIYAIDEELYRFIAASTLTPVKKIEATLRQFVTEQYNQDLLRYLLDCRDGRVKPKRRMDANNNQESPEETKRQRRREKASELGTLRQLRTDLQAANDKAKDISFSELVALKTNHNNIGTSLAGMGPSKLSKMISVGIMTGRQLLKSPTDEDEKFQKLKTLTVKPTTSGVWVDLVKKEFATREEYAKAIAAEVSKAEEELGEDVALLDDDEEDESMEDVGIDENVEYENFSQMSDREGYNARIVHNGAIKDVIAEEFNQQRFVMRDRMAKLGGQVLRLHFFYDIAKKINAFCKASNKNVIPFKCMAAVLNEKGQVIWWAMVRKERYIHDILGPLKKLKARLDRLECNVNAIFADDARICRRLQNIFEVVAFDLMKWLEDWNTCIACPDKNRAETFRALMCQAVIGVKTEDFKRERRRLALEYLRDPTMTEILRACNATAPTPEEQERAVMNIFMFFFHKDVEYAFENAHRPASRNKGKFFKNYDVVVEAVQKQLACIRSASLTLPNHAGNQVKTLCETLDRKVFGDWHFAGMRRAERGIWSVLDGMNSVMSGTLDVAQNPEDATPQTVEPSSQQVFANSLATSLGMDAPPYQVMESSSFANKSAESENLGFDVTFDEVNTGAWTAGDAQNEFEQYLDTVGRDDDHLIDPVIMVQAGEFKEQLDVPPVAQQDLHAHAPDVAMAEGGSESEDSSLESAQVDGVNDCILSNENKRKMFSRHERSIAEFTTEMEQKTGKSSLEVFKSLKDNESWALLLEKKPFVNDSEEPVHVEELKVFKGMNAVLSGPMANAEHFEKAWNWECGHRLKSILNGETKKPIFRKESKHLQEQRDRIVQLAKEMKDYIMACCREKVESKRTFQKFCITCAHASTQHNREIESYAQDCKKGFCARCGALKKWHVQNKSEMGFFCFLTSEQSNGRPEKLAEFDEYWRTSHTLERPTLANVVLKDNEAEEAKKKAVDSKKDKESDSTADSVNAEESMVPPGEAFDGEVGEAEQQDESALQEVAIVIDDPATNHAHNNDNPDVPVQGTNAAEKTALKQPPVAANIPNPPPPAAAAAGDVAPPEKRGPGRPRKHPLPEETAHPNPPPANVARRPSLQNGWFGNPYAMMPAAMMPGAQFPYAQAPGYPGYMPWYPQPQVNRPIPATQRRPAKQVKPIDESKLSLKDKRRNVVDNLLKQRYGPKLPFRKFCRRCGFAKKDHALEELSAGKCCTRRYCGRCNALSKYHKEYGSEMGFYCFLTTAQSSGNEFKIGNFDQEWRGNGTGVQEVFQSLIRNEPIEVAGDSEEEYEPSSDSESNQSAASSDGSWNKKPAAVPTTGAAPAITRPLRSTTGVSAAATATAFAATFPSSNKRKAPPSTSAPAPAPALRDASSPANKRRAILPTTATRLDPPILPREGPLVLPPHKSPSRKKAPSASEDSVSPSPRKKGPTSTPKETYRGRPNEPLEGGWPVNWVKTVLQRTGPDSKTSGREDRYWHSPGGKKFRSMVEVRKFLKALSMTGGDEAEAYKTFRSIDLGA